MTRTLVVQSSSLWQPSTNIYKHLLVGGFTPLKSISHLGWVFTIDAKTKDVPVTTNQINIRGYIPWNPIKIPLKIKNVTNHQPDLDHQGLGKTQRDLQRDRPPNIPGLYSELGSLCQGWLHGDGMATFTIALGNGTHIITIFIVSLSIYNDYRWLQYMILISSYNDFMI